MYHIFLIQSSVEGHLSYLHFLAITNKASMNIDEQVSHLGICPGMVKMGFEIELFPIFLETTKLTCKVLTQCWIPTSSEGMFHLLHILNSMCYYLSFKLSHSDWCKMESQVILIPISLMTMYLEFFKCFSDI